ncbi:MAG: hypothetical protein CYPHOPRED_002074 [Cyphobasidiales sp. Tagirdzhanova-0007]|nr:MAG: hypothetical protein CYPHOPRED_002074 [Cyphobasidiales sp. Tagirdzhanova-0007]
MRELMQKHGQAGWNETWKQGITPWDSESGTPRPPLLELIEEKKYAIPADGRAIVPGCGRGYDAAYFASLGHETWGVDISPIAIDAAKIFVACMPNPPSNVFFKALDFFNFELPQDGEKFTIGYDYTFFCALPPKMREDWGKRYAEIIKPGGIIITLIWPIAGDRPGGPPYSLSPELYEPVLSESFDRVYLEKPTRLGSEGRPGAEMMAIWKRKG